MKHAIVLLLAVWAACAAGATTSTTLKTTTKTTTSNISTTKTTKISTTKISTTKTTKISTTKSTKSSTTSPLLGTTRIPPSAGVTAYLTAVLISGTFDGGLFRYERDPPVCQGQTETTEPDAMFILEDGAKIFNAIIGATQAEGIHCRGTCTIENVWWADVCEDAAKFKQLSGTSYIIGGGAFSASDKIFQFNGRGTVNINGFYAEDYGKIIRSCGDCAANGGPRNVVLNNVTAIDGSVLCGINSNYGDTCRITNSCQSNNKTCDRYEGVTDHNGSSTKIGSGPDGISCFVDGFTNICT